MWRVQQEECPNYGQANEARREPESGRVRVPGHELERRLAHGFWIDPLYLPLIKNLLALG